MSRAYEIGRRAERLVRDYLISKGYGILATNWRWGKREIDIVGTFDHQLVIIEVKSRFHNVHPVPGEIVTMRKQKNLIIAAEGYILKNNIRMPVRFDIISVVFYGYNFDIEHIENAFFPEPE